MVFINKMDREGRDPYDLLDEIEEKLNIRVKPLSWPIGMGKSFKGVYNLYLNRLMLFQPSRPELQSDVIEIKSLSDTRIEQEVGENPAKQLRDEVSLVEGVYPEFDVQEYLDGKVAPVFFGSAVNNFGVRELLDCFIELAPPP